MTRPKHVEGEKTAFERMEDAFWAMLAEMPYHEITGTALRRKAAVSHSTFYYHFEDMDDLAGKMFARLASPEVPAAVMKTVLGGVGTAEGMAASVPGFEQRLFRMRLVTTNGSAFLLGLLREVIMRAWLVSTGVEEADLSAADRTDLAFAFGGLLALLGSDLANGSQSVAEFSQRELGQAAMLTMRRIASKPESTAPTA